MKEKIHPAKTFFLYLLTFTALYISAIAIGGVFFQLIEKVVPDPLSYASDIFREQALRTFLAMLIVTFPLYAFLSRYLEKAQRAFTELKTSGLRKWLTYITLFVAAATIIGDFVTLIHRFLGGEITMRFLLKVVVILVLAGGIFAFYLWDIRDQKKTKRPVAIYMTLLTLTACAGVVLGLFTITAPNDVRAKRLDERRIEHLQTVVWDIQEQYRKQGTVPENLEELLRRPVDPETKTPYEYRRIDATSYELCATFTTSNIAEEQELRPYYPLDRTWLHDAGRTCFTRTVEEEPGIPKPAR